MWEDRGTSSAAWTEFNLMQTDATETESVSEASIRPQVRIHTGLRRIILLVKKTVTCGVRHTLPV